MTMATAEELRKIRSEFFMGLLKIFTVISGVALIVLMLTGWNLWSEFLVSMGFYIFFGFAYGALWTVVVRGGGVFMHQFYLTMSVVRMIAIVAIIVVYQLIMRDTVALRNLAIVLFIYYIALLVYTSRFFSNIERKKRI
jgi:hypothetical protein